MEWDDIRDEDLTPQGRETRMRLVIAASLAGICLLGVLGGMLHILPA